MLQYLGPHDHHSPPLLGHIHALRFRRFAEKLPTVCVPFCEFWGAEYAGVSVFAVLEVSFDFFILLY